MGGGGCEMGEELLADAWRIDTGAGGRLPSQSMRCILESRNGRSLVGPGRDLNTPGQMQLSDRASEARRR